MPLLYKCKVCGENHQVPGLGYNSKAKFDKVPADNESGRWGCASDVDAHETYYRRDLIWHSDFEGNTYDALLKLHEAALTAKAEGDLEASKQLDEIEKEMDTRQFKLVAQSGEKVVEWGRCRTQEQCEELARQKGMPVGGRYERDNQTVEVIVVPA